MLGHKLSLLFCIIIISISDFCCPAPNDVSSEENFVEHHTTTVSAPTNNVGGNDIAEQEANLTKSVNLIHDLLLKTSQLIILNNLDKKVDAVISHLEQNNITQILDDFKKELLSEVRAIVSDSKPKVCEEPETVKSLLGSGRNCLIKNRRWPEYFYAAEGFDYDSERRQAFTWIPGYHDSQCFWNLERFEACDSEPVKYKIKAVKFDEYLYAGADDLKWDSLRRRVFTWKPKTSCEQQCYWDIQLVKPEEGETERWFTIRNTEYNEYFYAVDGANYDADRRQTFTWRYADDEEVTSHQSHWSIKCK